LDEVISEDVTDLVDSHGQLFSNESLEKLAKELRYIESVAINKINNTLTSTVIPPCRLLFFLNKLFLKLGLFTFISFSSSCIQNPLKFHMNLHPQRTVTTAFIQPSFNSHSSPTQK
jgi:hypothetical protein